MMTAPRITALFHTSPTVAAFLPSPTGRALCGDLLVECALRPALSYALNLEIPPSYPGVAGLLGGTDVATLAHATDALPAPIVLAAGTEVAPSLVRAALTRLQLPDERIQAVTLLIPIGDARAIGAALAVCDRFGFAWDVSEFPHEELLEFGRWIAMEGLLDRENLSGAFPYAVGGAAADHSRRISALLAPLSTPSTPVSFTVV